MENKERYKKDASDDNRQQREVGAQGAFERDVVSLQKQTSIGNKDLLC